MPRTRSIGSAAALLAATITLATAGCNREDSTSREKPGGAGTPAPPTTTEGAPAPPSPSGGSMAR